MANAPLKRVLSFLCLSGNVAARWLCQTDLRHPTLSLACKHAESAASLQALQQPDAASLQTFQSSMTWAFSCIYTESISAGAACRARIRPCDMSPLVCVACRAVVNFCEKRRALFHSTLEPKHQRCSASLSQSQRSFTFVNSISTLLNKGGTHANVLMLLRTSVLQQNKHTSAQPLCSNLSTTTRAKRGSAAKV